MNLEIIFFVVVSSCSIVTLHFSYCCFGFFFSYYSLLKFLQASAEADTFFCFVELLSGFRDNFVQQLDNSVVGIRSTITRLSQLLKEHDEELWRHLEMTTKVKIYMHSTSLLSASYVLLWQC